MKHLIFDIDDTLARTGDYIYNELVSYCLELSRFDLLEQLKEYPTADLKSIPAVFRTIIDEKIIPRELYLFQSKPTRLYNYFFMIPGNIDSQTKVSLCSMRGVTPNGEEKTKIWLNNFKPCIDIKDIHILNPKEHPSKLDYLFNLYGPDFLLIDDNPFYDLDKEYQKDNRIAIFEECAKYKANQHQNKIVYDSNFYRINGEIVR